MKILALETSAKSVSAAVTDGGVVRAYTYQNTGLTHSRTLMPLVDAMLRESEQLLSDMKSDDYENLISVFDRHFGDYVDLIR